MRRLLAITLISLWVGSTTGSAASRPAAAPSSLRQRIAAWDQLASRLGKGSNATRRATAAAALAAIESERAVGLRRYAVDRLARNQMRYLGRADQSRLRALFAEAFPRTPPVPSQGIIRIKQYIGEEFYEEGLDELRATGFALEKQGRLVLAQRGRLRVTVYRGDARVYRQTDDPDTDVIVFSGHADIGGVDELALRTAKAQQGDKLIVGLKCRGQQTLPLIAARYPNAHLIATRHSSYANQDNNLLRAIYDGLERGETYKQIRARARRRASIANYIFPDSADLAGYLDRDRDGRRDRADEHFDPPSEVRRTPGEKLLAAVGYVDSVNSYAHEDHSLPGRPGAIRMAFFSDGVATQSRARGATQIRLVERAGKPAFRVQLDPAFARAPQTVLGALATFEMQERLHRHLGLVTERDRLRAFTFALDYLDRMTESQQEYVRALAALSRVHGLPRLTYDEAFSLSGKTGTKAQLDELEGILASRAIARR